MALIQKAFSDIVTFSRSSNATRIGPTGLVEYAPHNLCLQSQTFDNASWTKANATVTANAVSAPDGTVTADKMIADATTNVHYLRQIISSGTYTFSVYAKAAEYSNLVMLGVGANHGASFNLANGTVTGVYGSATASIVSVGNGWYRCITSINVAGTDYYCYVDSAVAYPGDGTSGIYIWGAQLSVGPYPLDYTPTTSAAVYGPRFDYDPVTLAARGLLVEESRTNLALYSEDFSNAAWFGASTNGSTTANATVSPDGTNNADLFVPNTSSSVHRVIQLFSTSSALYSVSVYAKAGGYSRLSIFLGGANQGVVFDLSAVTVVADTRFAVAPSNMSIVSVGNGWYRCSFSSNISNSADNLQISPLNSSANPGDSWSGNGTSGMYFWGAQLEAGSFATSYLPTVASSVTRSADVASVNTLSPWFNASAGTLLTEFDVIGSTGASQRIASIDDSGGNGIFVAKSSTSLFDQVFAGGVAQANLSVAQSALNTVVKNAFAFAANDFAAVTNGGTVQTDNSGSLPTPTQLSLGTRYTADNQLNGHLRRVAFYPRRLTDAELSALTA